jgi:hypothetical protein
MTTPYHHLHADAAIDCVHEHVKFIWFPRKPRVYSDNDGSWGHTKAANRTSYGFPHSEEQANRRERFLPTAERSGIFVAISTLSAILVVGLDLRLKKR